MVLTCQTFLPCIGIAAALEITRQMDPQTAAPLTGRKTIRGIHSKYMGKLLFEWPCMLPSCTPIGEQVLGVDYQTVNWTNLALGGEPRGNLCGQKRFGGIFLGKAGGGEPRKLSGDIPHSVCRSIWGSDLHNPAQYGLFSDTL